MQRSSAVVAVFAFALALPIVAATTNAHAQQAQRHDPIAAEALFREGRAAAEAGNFSAACPKFRASYRLDPTQGALFNLADCEERTGQLSQAWQHYHQLLDQLPPSDDRRAYSQMHGDKLAPRLPHLRVALSGTAPGVMVLRDGEPLADAMLGASLPVDPGTHHIVVRASGHVDQTYDLVIAEGQQRDLAVSVGAALPPSAMAHAAPMAKPDARPARTIGFVVAGVGVASAAVGGIFGGLALADNGQSNAACNGGVCTNQGAVDLHERAKTEALVADVALFGGAALAVVGVVWIITASRGHHEAARAASVARLTPAIGPGSAGLWLSGSF